MGSNDPVGRDYGGGITNQQYQSHEPVQYARFESKSAPVNEDALPSMPTWSEATSTRVEEPVPVSEKRPGDMELHEMGSNASARRSPILRSPGSQQHMSHVYNDQYGFPAGYHNDSFVSESQRRSPGPNNGYAQPHYAAEEGGYRGMSPVHAQALSSVYGGAADYPQQQQPQQSYDRRSPVSSPYDQRQPSPGPNTAYTQHQQQHQQQHYDDRAYSPPAPAYSPTGAGAGSASYAYQSMDRPAPSSYPSAESAATTGYAQSGSTRFEPPNPLSSPAPAYPGQQTYPGEQSFQALNFQTQPVGRKPVDGSWKDV